MARTLPATGLDQLGLLDFLDTDVRPSFIVQVDPATTSGDASHIHKVVYANHSCRESTPQYVTSLSESSSLVSEMVQWLSWIKTARDGSSFTDSHSSWSLKVIQDQWRVFTCTTLQRTSSHEVESPRKTVFDLAFDSGCITGYFYELLRGVDWAQTPLGPLYTWRSELLHTVSLALSNPEACCIYWGPERTILYNQPFSVIIGDNHPALGGVAKTAFTSFYPIIEAIFQEVGNTGRPVGDRDNSVPLMRSDNSLEEGFFSYWHLPIKGPDGALLGVYNEVYDVTAQTVSQRRMSNLLKIGEASSSVQRLDQFWPAALQSFDFDASEVPFAAIYTRYDESYPPGWCKDRPLSDDESLKLQGTSGKSSISFPDQIRLSEKCGLALAIKNSSNSTEPFVIRVRDLERVELNVTDNKLPITEDARAVVWPLQVSSLHHAAWVVLGIPHLRPCDKTCRTFISLLTRQMETGAAALVLLVEELKELENTVVLANLEKLRLENELALKRQEAEYSAWRFLEFAKRSPVGVFIHGPEGDIKFANEAWYRSFGLPYGAQGSLLWRERIHPDNLAGIDDLWKQVVTHGKDFSHFEYRVRKLPSEIVQGEDDCRHLASTCFAELDQDGNFKSVTGLVVDNTVHRAHEREVAERLASALEAKRTQENFMGRW
ncbi:hypothetical protein ANO11243_056310 [Dothideomycetidae sp. 11243]|nr:hypothetical protein ANO11243_056310 [fungal sp. No.11243]